jgi:hypothetical protein
VDDVDTGAETLDKPAAIALSGEAVVYAIDRAHRELRPVGHASPRDSRDDAVEARRRTASIADFRPPLRRADERIDGETMRSVVEARLLHVTDPLDVLTKLIDDGPLSLHRSIMPDQSRNAASNRPHEWPHRGGYATGTGRQPRRLAGC